MDSIRSVQPPGKWKIIVVDSKSAQILNAACKMYDILEENVSQWDQKMNKKKMLINSLVRSHVIRTHNPPFSLFTHDFI